MRQLLFFSHLIADKTELWYGGRFKKKTALGPNLKWDCVRDTAVAQLRFCNPLQLCVELKVKPCDRWHFLCGICRCCLSEVTLVLAGTERGRRSRRRPFDLLWRTLAERSISWAISHWAFSCVPPFPTLLPPSIGFAYVLCVLKTNPFIFFVHHLSKTHTHIFLLSQSHIHSKTRFCTWVLHF